MNLQEAGEKFNSVSSKTEQMSAVAGNVLSQFNGSPMNPLEIEQTSQALENAVGLGRSAINDMTDLVDLGLGGENASAIKDKLAAATASLDNASAALSNVNPMVTKLESLGETKLVTLLEEKKKAEEDKAADMAYDGNGQKHYINKFIGVMSAEGMPFIVLAERRWAVDRTDQKVYGDAFLQKQSTQTFKTLDSDGLLYWYADFESRHYYGEAVDIAPTSSMSDLLTAMCLNDNVCDIMWKYGICTQIEIEETGPAKGTHFHCGTDRDNPQTKWWGIVNKRRTENNIDKLYPVIIESQYYEENTKNPTEIA